MNRKEKEQIVLIINLIIRYEMTEKQKKTSELKFDLTFILKL